jgi:hypothetical protein
MRRSIGGFWAARRRRSADEIGRSDARQRDIRDVFRMADTERVSFGHVVHKTEANLVANGDAARNEVAVQLMGRLLEGVTRLYLGEFVAARALLEQYHGLGDPAHRAVVGATMTVDPYVAMLANLAGTLAYLGYIGQARSRLSEALSEARRLRHSQTLAVDRLDHPLT